MALTPSQFRMMQALSPEEARVFGQMRGGSGANRIIPTGGGGGGGRGLIPRSGGVPSVRGNYPLSTPNATPTSSIPRNVRNVTPVASTAPTASRLARMSRLLGPLSLAMTGADIYNVMTDEDRQAADDQALADIGAESTGNESFSGAGFLEGLMNPFGYARALGSALGQANADLEEEERRAADFDQQQAVKDTVARMQAIKEERAMRQAMDAQGGDRMDEILTNFDPVDPDAKSPAAIYRERKGKADRTAARRKAADAVRNGAADEKPANDDYDPTKHDMYGSGLNDDYDPTKNDMYGTQTDEVEAVDYTDEAVGLFKNTHGTAFDPNSRVDREKLQKMKNMLAKQGGLGEMTPNQFALQVYRNS